MVTFKQIKRRTFIFMGSALLHTPPRTILEVFESLPEGTRCEVINNTLVMSPAPLDTHQKVLGKIFTKLTLVVEKNDLGELRIAPYDVHFSEQNIFQPDIILVANKNIHKINEHGCFGAPDLIIEVLSPSNARYDKEEKKGVYEKYGVKEYFIIEPYEKLVTGFVLLNKRFVLSDTQPGTINSKTFDFAIRF